MLPDLTVFCTRPWPMLPGAEVFLFGPFSAPKDILAPNLKWLPQIAEEVRRWQPQLKVTTLLCRL